jgi:hypothetical protein
MRDGLELQEFFAQLAGVNVERPRWWWARGQSFGEEVVVRLRGCREGCSFGGCVVAGRALRYPSSLGLDLIGWTN